jgi:23S rRNA (guanosine2251-2'-O)-methyltransferase
MDNTDDIQFLSGVQPVSEALRNRRRPLYRLHLSRRKGAEELVNLAEKVGIPVSVSDTEKVRRMAGNSKHQGVVLECGALPLFDIEEILRFEPPDGRDLLVLLSGAEDPRNLGAVARCCSFLGVRALLIPSKGTAPLSSSASRASAGALESLPMALVKSAPDACQSLAGAGYEIVGVEKGGDPLEHWMAGSGKTALVIGSEDRGLSRRVRAACNRIVTIEGEGPTGSLNLSVAAGIAIHHVMNQISKKKEPGARSQEPGG